MQADENIKYHNQLVMFAIGACRVQSFFHPLVINLPNPPRIKKKSEDSGLTPTMDPASATSLMISPLCPYASTLSLSPSFVILRF
eukprot:scaffold2952_cov40-Tisochrysis_lutea.AAC.3